MFKRIESNGENEFSLPAKRPKYDIKKWSLSDTSINNKDSRNKKYGRDDIWGDDFAEEDIEEMDFIATQACLQVLFILHFFMSFLIYKFIYYIRIIFQDDNIISQSDIDKKTFIENAIPSTSKINLDNNNHKISSAHILNNQRRKEENIKDISTVVSIDYNEFEDKLINKKIYNSTFKLDDATAGK